MSGIQIRRYRTGDAEAIRQISCETALYGRPMDALFRGRPLIAEALMGYYVEFEPEALFVAESEGKVVGYLTGCRDTRRFEELYARRIVPRLLWICLKGGYWLRPSFGWVAAATFKAGHSWAGVRDKVLAEYPAHCHLNLDAGFRHAGSGSALFRAFLEYLKGRGVRGMHILSATEGGQGFFTKAGFTLLARYPAPPLPGGPPRETWVMGKKLE